MISYAATLIEAVADGIDPHMLAYEEQLELDEAAPKDPYQRALFRIQSLLDRFGDDVAKVDQHTAARAKKTRNAEKLKGLIKAAKQLKLKKSVAAAQQQLATVG